MQIDKPDQIDKLPIKKISSVIETGKPVQIEVTSSF